MGYGHAEHLAAGGRQCGEQHTPQAGQRPKPAKADPPSTLAPDWYDSPDLAPVLTGHHVDALYRWLTNAGMPQRRIAALTGTTQPQVADILAGRQVQVYDVLVRIAEGLGIPRERMGLSFWGPDGTWYGPDGTYPEGVTVVEPEEAAKMLRRHLIALGGATLAGATVDTLGELLAELPGLDPVPLPARLSGRHVMQVRELTQRLAEVGNATIADPEVLSAAAARATRLLDVAGTEPVQRALRTAVAELHIEAGWSAFDAGLYQRAMYHYARALELATEAEDAYCQAQALGYAGMATVEHGHPDDGLKMLQCAQVVAWNIPADDQRAVVVGVTGRAAVEACQREEAATALARLGRPEAAYRELAAARDMWTPTRTDPYGDMDRPAARLEIERGRLDVAEQLAVASVRRWEGGSLISRTQSGIVLATVHVKAGDPRGLHLAHDVITAAAKLTSVRARKQLEPLAVALEARRGSDYAELARSARQVATVPV